MDRLTKLEMELRMAGSDEEWAEAMGALYPVYSWVVERNEEEEAGRRERTPEGKEYKTEMDKSPPTTERKGPVTASEIDWNHLLLLVDRALELAHRRPS
jgi:hypothetical protein